ncbi:dTMP kinase [Haloferax sp. wsp5]|nr:dTMP kinase [Haloferax sp. wsp5]
MSVYGCTDQVGALTSPHTDCEEAVTLEGLDGSGMTTVWERLRATTQPQRHCFTREPTDTWYGDAVQRSSTTTTRTRWPNCSSIRQTTPHTSRRRPTGTRRGRLVVSDRYTDSRYAYQAARCAESDARRPLSYVREVHAPWTRPPDKTIYLDLDPETAAARSGATNKFEQAAYLADVRENYERLVEADPERFVRVDATADPDTVSTGPGSGLVKPSTPAVDLVGGWIQKNRT